VSVDANLAAQANEVNDAVALWNNAGAYVGFVVVPNGGAITITNAAIGMNACAHANGFPVNGIPTNQVQVDAVYEASPGVNLNYGQRMVAIAHELGHCIGFRHTNGDACCGFGTPVPGWGGTDASSIMNGNYCGISPTVLSAKDIGAVKALYPKINYPQNTVATVSPSNFSVTWSAPASNPSDALVGYQVWYSGFSGTNFGGTVNVSTSTFSYTIPGANPSAPGTSGYFRVTISAVYASGATISGTMQSWFKTGTTWHQ
jgi:hypothetical protein